jgi:hypothetical protein
VVGLEFDPFERQSILVVQREDFFLSVDRRPAFDVVGMDGDKAHLVLALDPANRLKVVSLNTDTPNVVVPSLNPAAGVTYGPAPGDWVPSQPCTYHPCPAGNRIPLDPVANGCRKTRREGIQVHRINRYGRARGH